MKFLLLFSFVWTFVLAEYEASIETINVAVKKRMITGKSWRASCPVALKDLRYLRLTYIDFQGQEQKGEMIVHKEVAFEVKQIFAELYSESYPIEKMHLVSKYKGNDWQSIEAGNTSAFNCRAATGSKKWSKHAYGKAIDLNPLQNPYIASSGRISHKASLKYRKRIHKSNSPADKALLLKKDVVVKIFKKYGWIWGGDWRRVKDYQHFSKE